MNGALAVRGGATPEQLAAVLAIVARAEAVPPAPTAYERWRAGRLRANRSKDR